MRDGQAGAATPISLAIVAVVVVTAVGLADVGRLLAVRLEVAAAADAAALAAAPVTFAPFGARGSPAFEASRFAVANGASLVSCRCPVDRSWDSRYVEVVVERTVRLWMLGSVTLRVRSRAQFVPAALQQPP